MLEAALVVLVPLLEVGAPGIRDALSFGTHLVRCSHAALVALEAEGHEVEAPAPRAVVRRDLEAAAVEARLPLLARIGREVTARVGPHLVARPLAGGEDTLPVRPAHTGLPRRFGQGGMCGGRSCGGREQDQSEREGGPDMVMTPDAVPVCVAHGRHAPESPRTTMTGSKASP